MPIMALCGVFAALGLLVLRSLSVCPWFVSSLLTSFVGLNLFEIQTSLLSPLCSNLSLAWGFPVKNPARVCVSKPLWSLQAMLGFASFGPPRGPLHALLEPLSSLGRSRVSLDLPVLFWDFLRPPRGYLDLPCVQIDLPCPYRPFFVLRTSSASFKTSPC